MALARLVEGLSAGAAHLEPKEARAVAAILSQALARSADCQTLSSKPVFLGGRPFHSIAQALSFQNVERSCETKAGGQLAILVGAAQGQIRVFFPLAAFPGELGSTAIQTTSKSVYVVG